MGLTAEQKESIQWPPLNEPITKAEALRLLRARQALEYEAAANEEQEHADAMYEWRSTIGQRLLAIIPALEDGSFDSASNFAMGSDVDRLRPPRRHEYYIANVSERTQAEIDVVEAIGADVFSSELRRALYRSGIGR